MAVLASLRSAPTQLAPEGGRLWGRMTPTVLAPRADGDCPLERAVGQLADKWKLKILLRLVDQEVVRFRELQRQLEGVSQKVLTKALRELEADGLVVRTVYAEVPPRVEYRPSERCARLLPILAQLQDWAVAD